MRTNNQFKIGTLLAVVALVIITFFACDEERTETPKQEDAKELANDANDAKFEDRDQENDAEFMVKVADINLDEIKFGQLAQSKSKDNDVKKLGKMMETEHTKAQEELVALAKTKGATLPATISEEKQKKYDEMNAMEEKDFNDAYTDMMVKGHKDAINLFERRENRTEDAEVKAWVQKMLPSLKAHLEHSEQCEKKIDEKNDKNK